MGAMEQDTFTVPENPLIPTTLTGVVLPVVAPGEIEIVPGWKPLGGPKPGVTFNSAEVEAVIRPVASSLPLMVAV